MSCLPFNKWSVSISCSTGRTRCFSLVIYPVISNTCDCYKVPYPTHLWHTITSSGISYKLSDIFSIYMSPYKLYYEKTNINVICFIHSSTATSYSSWRMTGDFSCRRHYANTANRMLGSKLIAWTRVYLNRSYGTLCIDCQVI
jgi:hypothetical protein